MNHVLCNVKRVTSTSLQSCELPSKKKKNVINFLAVRAHSSGGCRSRHANPDNTPTYKNTRASTRGETEIRLLFFIIVFFSLFSPARSFIHAARVCVSEHLTK